MFPKSKIDLFYRVLCMLAYLGVIVFIDSFLTLLIITIAFYIFTIGEKKVENIYLYVITFVLFVISLTIKNYLLLRVIVFLDYIYYFISAPNYDDDLLLEEEITKDQKYIRFKKNKKIKRKEDNNMICTLFVTIHLLLLLLSVMVG